MEIKVAVVPNSRVAAVTKVDETSYRVKVNAKALEGKANERLIEILAEHFKVSRSHIRILKGASGRSKIVEILA